MSSANDEKAYETQRSHEGPTTALSLVDNKTWLSYPGMAQTTGQVTCASSMVNATVLKQSNELLADSLRHVPPNVIKTHASLYEASNQSVQAQRTRTRSVMAIASEPRHAP